MIADDTDGIREALDRLKKERDLADLECRRKAAVDAKPLDLPPRKPLFSDSAPPFRGFFTEGLEPPVPRPGGLQFKDGTRSTSRDSNFTFDEEAWDEWDQVNLDSGVTGDTAPDLFMWGRLD
jgi:hypothetical protein